ncbi:MAG: heparinase II/III family protein [Lachnospiraceae bacterium]
MNESNAIMKLQELVCQVEQYLEDNRAYLSEGNQVAAWDMLNKAKKALKEKDTVPFRRNREFCVPREMEAAKFAYSRYSMVPSFITEGVHCRYGLKECFEWLKSCNLKEKSEDEMIALCNRIEGECKEFLGSAVVGNQVGQYPLDEITNLTTCLNELVMLRNEVVLDWDATKKKLIEVQNALRELRFSRVLRSDVDSGAFLYLTKEGLEKQKEIIEQDPFLSAQLAEIKKQSQLYTLEQVKRAWEIASVEDDYEYLNNNFYVWSYNDKLMNVVAPRNATHCRLRFVLPSIENEEEGLGHVWLDDVHVLGANVNNLPIENTGFEEGENGKPVKWRALKKKGSPVVRWESEYPYCGMEKNSLYMENPTSYDECVIEYEDLLPIIEEEAYSVAFRAKLDGKLKEGLRVELQYYDAKGNVLDIHTSMFNRKSAIANGGFMITGQSDAIMYAMTGDKMYAEKTKYQILYAMHDFSQGAENWMVYNLRPEGCDAFGAVQGGRILANIGVMYSMIKDADVFSADEKALFYEMVDYLLPYMLDLRDRTEMTITDVMRGASNWQTDMCAGTVYLTLALDDDYPNRKQWLYNAISVLHSQLLLNINEDGSWPESIRYHHAALQRFAGVAKVVRFCMGDDWFRTTKLGSMFDYSLHMQTPAYEYFGNHVSTPPFGDHVLGDGKEFAVYLSNLDVMEEIDKQIADNMYVTWQNAGKPVMKLGTELVALDTILGKGSGYQTSPGFEFHLESSKAYKNAGIYVFRKNFGRRDQSYFAIMSSPKPIAHGHHDQGSFVLYKDSVPLVMDSGIEGYFDSSVKWHKSAYSHACVLFETMHKNVEKDKGGAVNLSAGTFCIERGWAELGTTSKVISCEVGSDIESIVIEIQNEERNGIHRRSVYYLKEEDLYLIHDEISDFDGKVQYSVPICSKDTEIHSNVTHSTCYYDMELDIVFLSKTESIRIEEGRTLDIFPSNQEVPMLQYVRAVADAKDGFLTMLVPKRKGVKNPLVERSADGIRLVTNNGREYNITIKS